MRLMSAFLSLTFISLVIKLGWLSACVRASLLYIINVPSICVLSLFVSSYAVNVYLSIFISLTLSLFFGYKIGLAEYVCMSSNAVHHFNVPVALDVLDRFIALHYTDWELLNGRNINNGGPTPRPAFRYGWRREI